MAFKMKGNPMYRNFGIGKSPAKQATPDVEGEKKVMDKRTKAIESHRKNAPKTVNTQEQADQLNKMDADNVAAYNTSRDSIIGVHDAYNKHIEKQQAVSDSTSAANKAAFDKYMKSTKKKSPNKQFEEGDYYDTRSKKSPNKQRDLGGTKSGKGNAFTKRGRTQKKINAEKAETAKLTQEHIAENKRSTYLATKDHEAKMIKKQLKNRPKTVVMKGEKDVTNEYKSPAKQGYRPTTDKKGNKIDYTDPEVLKKEKEGNKRIHDIRTGEYDKLKKRKLRGKSPAKCPLIAAAPAIIGAVGAMKKMKDDKEK